jgi:2-keto-4-pentenoate hydratase
MIPEEAGKLLWESALQGLYYPYALQGRLTMDEAYRVQLAVLERQRAAGEAQAGWKIGLTADAVRKHYRSGSPVHGYLLGSGGVASGHAFDAAAATAPSLETELCFTLDKDLHGPGVTEAQVLDAIGAVAPAFEIIERRGDMAADLPLGVADNVSQWAYVLGRPVRPYPKAVDLGAVRMELFRNGQAAAGGVGREVIDHPVRSLVWLANRLAAFGYWLAAGQIVLTGSFNKPLPAAPGDRWEARFTGLGAAACTVACSFA